MLMKGVNTRLFLIPGIESVRLVISKLVKEIVVLRPIIRTLIIAKSWLPKPVNRVLPEKGVMNVHPDIVNIELGHLTTWFFLRLFWET